MPELNARLVCGVDEAGRGPLAGPVYAAAVILSPESPIGGLADSKTLSAKRREQLSIEIRTSAIAWAIASATVEEIDKLNILRASLLAMKRAVGALAIQPEMALIDGTRCPDLDCAAQAIVRADATIPAVSAASILAKVERDAEMLRLHAIYPQYGLDRHKGYPTPAHLAAIARFGACKIHRRSFAPVRKALEGEAQ